MEFRNRAERNRAHLTELSQRNTGPSLHQGSRLAGISSCSVQGERWEREPSSRGIQQICLSHVSLEKRTQTPQRTLFNCTNRIILTYDQVTSPKSCSHPPYKHDHLSSSKIWLFSPPSCASTEYHHRILGPTSQSKTVLKGLTET